VVQHLVTLFFHVSVQYHGMAKHRGWPLYPHRTATPTTDTLASESSMFREHDWNCRGSAYE